MNDAAPVGAGLPAKAFLWALHDVRPFSLASQLLQKQKKARAMNMLQPDAGFASCYRSR